MGRRLHLTGNVYDLSRQLDRICQEIPQEITRVLYHSITRRVTDCIQARATVDPAENYDTAAYTMTEPPPCLTAGRKQSQAFACISIL
ncbi:hypothetical protein TNCV_1581491 [Trichonephila clavipes]|nr:hypothetical protein TNCV_1581491 [Trichonephila clavipes]